MRQERRLNSFHLRCLRCILGVKWQDHITNSEILPRADISSMHSLLSQRRLRWLEHVQQIDDGRIPKEVLYGQLTAGVRKVGRPALWFMGACKRDLNVCEIDSNNWKDAVCDRDSWRRTVTQNSSILPSSNFMCSICSKDCHLRIGLHSHTRRCSTAAI